MYRVPSAFFDQLIEHIDPHAPKRSAQRMHAQHICAAWLVLLRVQLNLTLDDVAEAAGIPQPILCRLESGIAGNVSETPNLVARLGETLARPGIEARRIAQVATIAAGGAEPSPNVMAEVLDDVERGSLPQDGFALVFDLHADEKEQLELLFKNEVAINVLRSLATQQNGVKELRHVLDPQRSIKMMVEISAALEALRTLELVKRSETTYVITAMGRQTLTRMLQQRHRRETEEAKKKLGDVLPGSEPLPG